ncbi:MAG: hypothetical protein ACFB8W_14170, partial [Elainellaceae cyanobacterium]
GDQSFFIVSLGAYCGTDSSALTLLNQFSEARVFIGYPNHTIFYKIFVKAREFTELSDEPGKIS